MVDSRTAWCGDVGYGGVGSRVGDVVAAAAAHVGLPVMDVTPRSLGRQLHVLSRGLQQRIAASADPADESVTVELLVWILKSRCELLDYDLARRVEPLVQAHHGLGDLRGLSSQEMVRAAPVVLGRRLGFSRSMISAVRGSAWLPQHLHIADEHDPAALRLREYIDGAQIPLMAAPLETEVVRKRRGALVCSPADDKRTFKEFVEVADCFGYIAAPITMHSRTIGLLHADRPQSHGVVTMEHLARLESFAEGFSVAFESAVLAEKAAQQRIEVDNLHATIGGLPGASTLPVLEPFLSATHQLGLPGRCYRGRPAHTALTAREQQIMAHVAAGATNGEIARSLVISEGTVKSHLKRIAKKLNTSSRAAAVAVYTGTRTGTGTGTGTDTGGRGER